MGIKRIQTEVHPCGGHCGNTVYRWRGGRLSNVYDGCRLEHYSSENGKDVFKDGGEIWLEIFDSYRHILNSNKDRKPQAIEVRVNGELNGKDPVKVELRQCPQYFF